MDRRRNPGPVGYGRDPRTLIGLMEAAEVSAEAPRQSESL